jgi:hypothetical protein
VGARFLQQNLKVFTEQQTQRHSRTVSLSCPVNSTAIHAIVTIDRASFAKIDRIISAAL